jgi:hypothetical protein
MADIILVDLESLCLVIGTTDVYRDDGLRAATGMCELWNRRTGSGFNLHEVGNFPRLGAFFYICRSLSLEDISHGSIYLALGAQWGWQLNGCFWRVGRVGRGHVGYSWRCSVMSIKFKISKTPIEYTLGFLDWFVGSFKTVHDAYSDAEC